MLDEVSEKVSFLGPPFSVSVTMIWDFGSDLVSITQKLWALDYRVKFLSMDLIKA